jgi:hypothetical protein
MAQILLKKLARDVQRSNRRGAEAGRPARGISGQGSPRPGHIQRRRLPAIAGKTVILEVPVHFQAVAQVYRNWRDLTDEDVIRTMAEWESRRASGEC